MFQYLKGTFFWRPRAGGVLAFLLFIATVITCESQAVPTNTNEHESASQRDLLIGSEISDPGRFPYYASVQWNNVHLCGGTLVAPNLVLTAAHCQLALNSVVIGQPGDSSGVETIGILKIIQHPLFHYQHQIFDQMILVLERPSSKPFVNLNLNDDIPSTTGDPLLVIGMGDSEMGNEASRPDELYQLEVEYLTQAQCLQYQQVKNLLTDDHMCMITTTQNSGGCNGDSGGPLLMLGATPSQDVQVGVVSLGYNCNYNVAPGIGSRTSFSEFIENTVCEESTEPQPAFCGPSSGRVADAVAIPTGSTCKAVSKKCENHGDCCSQRCLSNICRADASQSSKTALGRTNGVRGGASARKEKDA